MRPVRICAPRGALRTSQMLIATTRGLLEVAPSDGGEGGGALCNFFLLDPHADAAPFRMIFRIQLKGPPESIDPIFSPFSFFLYSGARQFELVMHL